MVTDLRRSTFATIGTDVSGATSVNEVLERAKLNYTVAKTPIYVMENGEIVEFKGKKATVIEETGQQLGIVTDQYQICQNQEAFDFVDYVSDDLTFVKAGQTHTGLIYMIASLPNVQVLGDSITPYVIFQNSHDGLSSVRATISPLRIVCQNQFNLSFRDSSNTLSIRHSGDISNKLIEGRAMLSDVAGYMERFNDEAEVLAGIKLNRESMNNIFNQLFKYDPSKMSPKQVESFEQKRAEFLFAYEAEDNQNFKGTGWGMMNAATDILTHKRLTNRANAADSAFMTTSITSRELTNLHNMILQAA